MSVFETDEYDEEDPFPDGLQPHEFFAMSKQHTAKASKQESKYNSKKLNKKNSKKKILNKISPPRAEFLMPGIIYIFIDFIFSNFLSIFFTAYNPSIYTSLPCYLLEGTLTWNLTKTFRKHKYFLPNYTNRILETSCYWRPLLFGDPNCKVHRHTFFLFWSIFTGPHFFLIIFLLYQFIFFYF